MTDKINPKRASDNMDEDETKFRLEELQKATKIFRASLAIFAIGACALWAGTSFNLATAPVFILLYHYGVDDHIEITLTLWFSGLAVGVLISGFLPNQE